MFAIQPEMLSDNMSFLLEKQQSMDYNRSIKEIKDNEQRYII